MAERAKAELHRNEQLVFQTRHETGIQAMRSWLFERQVDVNRQWPGLTGEDLIRMQGEAGLVGRLIRMIDQGPSIKFEGGE